MDLLKTFLSRFNVIALLSIISVSTAHAGIPVPVGTMSYRIPGATGIPTLSSTMLIVLSLLLFAVAFRVARQKNSGVNKMFVTLLAVGALSLIIGGNRMITEADAGVDVSGLPLNTGPTTGSVELFNGFNEFTNENTAIVTILGINITEDGYSCGADPSMSGRTTDELAAAPPPVNSSLCTVGLGINNLDGCRIFCNLAVSDIRLKRDIKSLTQLENRINLYSFKYKWSDQAYVGVMAQDLLKDSRYKDAVLLMDNDFYAVDYNALGLKMVTLDQWQESPANIFKL